MAWNPSPRVADCRDIARKWGGKKQVIVIAFESSGAFEMATYGETRALCDEAARLGDAAIAGISFFGIARSLTKLTGKNERTQHDKPK